MITRLLDWLGYQLLRVMIGIAFGLIVVMVIAMGHVAFHMPWHWPVDFFDVYKIAVIVWCMSVVVGLGRVTNFMLRRM